ncbi:hypothetical protein [Methylophilus aquaticus]|uniref:DUF2946 domain-containing protein n=1 Tax=Methylophilus aquaticus TaxID=1971610 RepID=A0ABT9JRS0_9PROT|nr:hypothetical protein [Methylophilus aquaticus]MDP8567270.1 hypothetical protein [Methylophilus aquaticus]
MRKYLCMFLICWLPCFVMAANGMSLQMMLADQTVALPISPALQSQVEAMPCHHMTDAHASGAPEADQQSPHKCSVCGFCMVSTGVAHLEAFPAVSLFAQSHAAPLFEADPVHSQTYPPAIKPPIFA